MKTKRILLLVFSLAALVLEILPYGVVLNFGQPDGEPWRRVYSYFSPVPYGYANFGPLISAILTCVLVILTFVGLFRYGKGLEIAVMNVSGFAAAASLAPLLFGMEITVIAVAVTVCLAAVFGICFLKQRKKNYEQ